MRDSEVKWWSAFHRVLYETTNGVLGRRLVGNDMLLLQWGAMRPLDISAPTDLRRLGSGKVAFVPQKLRYLDFTRQVFAPAEESDEFDDLAVQMSVTLTYSPADGTEPNANLWIDHPDEVRTSTRAFRDDPYVKSLILLPTRAVTVIVDHCG